MKKIYILILFIFLFLPSFAFSKPSFEVYQEGQTPYPTAILQSMDKPPLYDDLIIKVDVFDVSGVSSVVAMIIDPYGNETATVSMLNDGNFPDTSSSDSIYTVKINNVKNYSPGTYQVVIMPIDNLNHAPDNPIVVGTFTVEQVFVETCSTSGGYKICAIVPTLSNSNQISIPVITPGAVKAGENISISSTFKTQIAGKTISFKDSTDNVIIGSAVTNSLGVASFSSYKVPLSASIGAHTITAEYAGSPVDEPSYKSANLAVTSPGTCFNSSGSIICVDILTSLNLP